MVGFGNASGAAESLRPLELFAPRLAVLHPTQFDAPHRDALRSAATSVFEAFRAGAIHVEIGQT